MIEPGSRPAADDIAHHYDELDLFYRALWGEHLHHGLWTTGREPARAAAIAMVEEVAARARIGPGSQVCDVGCGYGAPARILAEAGAAVTGLTLSPVQHAHAVRRTDAAAHGRRPAGAEAEDSSWQTRPPADRPSPTNRVIPPRFLLRDWLENGLAPERFDAVIAIESLAHMPSRSAALAEAFRVLKPGGRLVACVWLAAPDPAAWEVRHLLRPICEEGRLPGLAHAHEYLRWATGAGFHDVELEDVSKRVARTWGVCARRLGGALVRPDAWRYLLDRRNRERRFALSVLRLLVGYRTGAVRYGILTARRPVDPAERSSRRNGPPGDDATFSPARSPAVRRPERRAGDPDRPPVRPVPARRGPRPP